MAKTLFILNDPPYWVQWADRTPKPAVTLRQPSCRWHLGKVWVEKSWLYTKL
jgi:hypothetical protein